MKFRRFVIDVICRDAEAEASFLYVRSPMSVNKASTWVFESSLNFHSCSMSAAHFMEGDLAWIRNMTAGSRRA